MDFKSALEKVYKLTRNKEQLNNPFIVYSRVSDLIGNSYNDKKKVELFFKIAKEVNLFSLFAEYGKNGKNKIICRYNEVEELLSKESFVTLVNFVYSIVFENNVVKHNCKKSTTKIMSKEQCRKNRQQKKESAMERHFQSNSYQNKSVNLNWIFLCIAMVVAIGLTIFGKHITWNVWQWIIGIGGGILLIVASLGIIRLIDNILGIKYFASGTILLFILTIANFVLQCIFIGNYRIIFVCYCLILFVADIVLMVMAFRDCKNSWGRWQVRGLVLMIILFAIGMIIHYCTSNTAV